MIIAFITIGLILGVIWTCVGLAIYTGIWADTDIATEYHGVPKPDKIKMLKLALMCGILATLFHIGNTFYRVATEYVKSE